MTTFMRQDPLPPTQLLRCAFAVRVSLKTYICLLSLREVIIASCVFTVGTGQWLSQQATSWAYTYCCIQILEQASITRNKNQVQPHFLGSEARTGIACRVGFTLVSSLRVSNFFIFGQNLSRSLVTQLLVMGRFLYCVSLGFGPCRCTT